MKTFLFVMLLLSGKLFAGDTDKSGGGIAVHGGWGTRYGGIGGVSLEYQFLFNPPLRMTPFLSAGSAMSTEPTKHKFGYCLGTNMELGKWHRFITGPSFGTQWVESDSGNQNEFHTLHGLSFVAGYKGTARFGLLWQVYLGIAYITDYKFTENQDNPVPAFGIGLGYKF